MIAPVPPVAPILDAPVLDASPQDVTATQPTRIDAFQSAMNAVGAALRASPDAMGQSLLAGLDGFRTRAVQVQQAVARDIAPTGATSAATLPPVSPDMQAMLTTMQKNQTQALGVMMQTYDFAMQAEMISRAATAFTSSINTLVKTQ
jgi:hypothetical protein